MRHVGSWSIALSAFALTVVGCSPSFSTDGLDGAAIVSGSLLPLSNGSASSSLSSSLSLSALGGGGHCTDPFAYVCHVADMGDCKGAALGSTPVASDGSYSFRMAELGLPVSSQEIRYAVAIEGCDETYARPITGSKNQDIDLATTLVSYVQTSNAARKLGQVTPSELGSFLSSAVKQLSGSDLSALYVALKTNSSLASHFQTLFGLAPLALEQAAPRVLSMTRPAASFNEGGQLSLAVSTSHWNPSYNTVYAWKLDDNAVLGRSTTLNYTLDPNSQGARTITLYVGADDGSGGLDINKPVASFPMSFTVANTVLPQAPAFSLASPALSSASDPTSTRSLILAVNTGALRANCASFSSLALSEDSSNAPDASEFTLACTSAGTQNLSYSLQSSGDGTKTVALWVKDSSGVISATASSLSVNLDTISPTVTISSSPAALLNASSASVAFTATDVSSIAGFECALDAGGYSACTSPKSYSGLTAGAHTISVRATDAAANVASAATAAFLVDLTAPTVAISSSPASLIGTRSASFAFSGTDESGGSGVASFECSMDAGSYSACTSPASFSSLTDGSHTFRVKAIDGAGNLTATAASSTFSVDATAPTLSISALAGPYTGGTSNNAASVVSVQWTATDSNTASTQSFVLEYSTNNGSSWNSLGAKSAANGPLSAQAFSYAWTVPSGIDTAQAKVRVLFTDLAGNVATPVVTPTFAIDSTKPTISSFVLAGGSATTALPTVAAALSASDPGADSSGVVSMQIGENSTSGSTWSNHASASTFLVSQTNGPKTVYVWVKDAAGNVSDSASYNISLDFGNPPVVAITGPAAGATYNPGDVVPISWDCQTTSSVGLAALPVPFIRYTIDDGVTFFDIVLDRTNNDSSTTGSYNWTVPATAPTTPSATSMTNKPFRILVGCKSAAGVVSTAYSQPVSTGGWSVFMGDPTFADVNVNATNAVAATAPGSRSTLASDTQGNIFYTKSNQALMRIDAATGYVTLFGGNLYANGCTWASGRAVSEVGYDRITNPVLVGANSGATALYVTSNSCGKVYSIRAVDGIVLDAWTLSPGVSKVSFVAGGRYLFWDYWSGADNALYRMDLGVSGSSAIRIAGNGTTLSALPTVGQDALQIGGPNPSGNVHRLFATSDAKRVYFSGAGDATLIRYDDPEGDGTYLVGALITGSAVDSTGCTATRFDSKVYCQPRHVGRTINVFDLATETWGPTRIVPFTNNDNGGFLWISTSDSRLLTFYSLNAIHSIDTTNMGSALAYTLIAGKPLSIFGNGSDPSQVAFQNVFDMHYYPGSQRLYVGNSGHLRLVDMSVAQYTTSTIYTAIASAGRRIGFNLAETTAVSTPDTCGSGTKIFKANLASGALMASPMSSICGSTAGYPIAASTPAPASSAGTYFTFGVSGIYTNHTMPVVHANGKTYFGAASGINNVFIWSTDGTNVVRVAGKTGAGGYSSDDHGTAALGATLKNTRMMQELTDGDLLIWDGDFLRRITTGSQVAGSACPNGGVAPCIYDLVDFRLAAGFTSGTVFRDAYYDATSEISGVSGSGVTYYVTGANVVRKFVPATISAGVVASATDTAYSFNGTTLSGDIRLALTPAGLLVVQPTKRRILRVSP